MDSLNPNLAARLAGVAARHPDRHAIVEWRGGRPRRLSFAELARRVAAVSAGFTARGIAPGERVLIFVPMSADLYIAMLAVLHAGATAVFVDAWAGRVRVDAAVRAARPRAFIGIPRAHLLRLASAPIRDIPIQLVAGRSLLPLERYQRDHAAGPPARVAADTPALVTFTTGTTGRPRATARSHGFLWAQHRALSEHLGLVPDDVDMPTLPIFVLNNLALGITSVLPCADPRRPSIIDAPAVCRQIEAEGVTTSSGSPAFYERLCRWCASNRRRLPLRALFTGGAPVPPPLVRLLADTVTGSAHVLYGSTEAEPIAGIEARAMLELMARQADGRSPDGICVGRAVHGITVRLVRAHDQPITLGAGGWPAWEVEPGAVGEVVVTGDHVVTGYLEDPEADRAHKIREPIAGVGERIWHRTGDGARLDAEGRLWLMGRVRWRVRREGHTWWSIPPEVRALKLAGVRHAAYFGIPDSSLGQRAVLCVEYSGGDLGAEERERLRIALAPSPIDEAHGLGRIPRDPRHESKTNMEDLVRALGERLGGPGQV